MSVVETWRPIVGYEGLYDVSDHGRVRSWVPWNGRPLPHLLTPCIGGKKPTFAVGLHRDGSRRTVPVRRAVLDAFVGPASSGDIIRHIDGDATNNHLTNLAVEKVSPRDATREEALAFHSTPMESGCIEWTGHGDDGGYGRVHFRGKAYLAHRFAWNVKKGPIPEGLHLDHLCRNRACVNTAHLEPVTPAENTRRGIGPAAINAAKTHCDAGHEFTPANTVYSPNRPRSRSCRECRALAAQRRSDAEFGIAWSVPVKEVRRWAAANGHYASTGSFLGPIATEAWNQAHPDRPFYRVARKKRGAA